MTNAPDEPEWSTEVIAKTFRAELHARFRAHNEAFRTREEAELAAVLAEHPEKRGQAGYEVRDSFAWEVLEQCQIRIESNMVTIVMPMCFAFRTDLLPLFDHMTMAWSRPIIGATIIDGEARPTIEIMLVATWTDAMHEKWCAEGQDRKRVDVELFEDDVKSILDVLRPQADKQAICKRLELALEPIP